MITFAITVVISLLMFAMGALSFYWVNLRPERSRRRAFYDAAMPRDVPGLTERKSIFERLDDITTRQGEQGEQIAAIQRALHIPGQRQPRVRSVK